MTCEEGEQYARRLADAGVPVELTRYDGMARRFFSNCRQVPGWRDSQGTGSRAAGGLVHR